MGLDHGEHGSWTFVKSTNYSYDFKQIMFFDFNIHIGKVAAVAFLLAVQGPTYYKRRMFLFFIAGTNAALAVPSTLLSILQCSPVDTLWNNPTIVQTSNKCVDKAFVYFISFCGGWCAFSDLALAIYPIFLIWPLQIDRRLKIILCFLLSLGVGACVAACIRTWEIKLLQNNTDPSCK